MPIYDTIKAQEANFPLPAPSATVTVGSFNANTGDFHYAVPIYHETVATHPGAEVGGGSHPEREQFTGGEVVALNALTVKLRFQVTGRQGPFSVSVPGHGTVSVSANPVEIDVGSAGSVTFSLSCSGQTFDPEPPRRITRPVVGAGAITIPALPITIIYAPPVDQQHRNFASWTGGELTGTTTSVSFSEQNSVVTPMPSPFEPWLALTAELRVASAVLSKIENEYAKIAGAALGVIAGILGTSTTTEGSGTTVLDQNTLTLTVSSDNTIETNPDGGGPGSADVVFFLKNAKILWFANDGQMKLALLGWDAVDPLTASFLHNPTASTGLDLATRTALLNLDPFVAGGPGAVLAPPRYVYMHTIDVNATYTYTYTESYTITNTDRSQRVRTRFFVEDDTASFLAFANIGVTQTLRAETILTQTSTSETTSATTITRQVKFFANPDEYYSVEVYCDVIFGTFAFRSIGVTATDRIRGRIYDPDGQPLAFEEVTLTSGDQEFRSLTNEKGEFAFRAATLGFDEAEIRARSTTKTLDLYEEATHDIEIHHHRDDPEPPNPQSN